MNQFEASFAPRFDSADFPRPEGWAIRGRVKQAIEFAQQNIDFGKVSEFAQPLPPETMSIKPQIQLEQIIVKCDSPDFEVSAHPSAKDGSRFDLLVSSPKKLPQGVFAFQVEAIPFDTSGVPLGKRRVAVSGQIVSDIQASPPNLLFGNTPVGMTGEEEVSLRSLTNRDFTVTEIRTDGQGIAVEQLTTAEPKKVKLRVRQTVKEVGQFQGKVIVTCELRGGGTTTCELPVTGYGVTRSEGGE